eukprot:362998-Chlamydomonas_euryale.AAC.5
MAGDRPPAPKQDPQLGFRAQARGEGLPHEQVEEGGQRATLAHPCNPHAPPTPPRSRARWPACRSTASGPNAAYPPRRPSLP